AAALSIDPLEFRLKNLKDERLRAVLQAAAGKFGWGKMKPEPTRGFGLSCGVEKGGYVATCAEISISQPGSKVKIERVVAACECARSRWYPTGYRIMFNRRLRRDVAHALLRAASRLISTLALLCPVSTLVAQTSSSNTHGLRNKAVAPPPPIDSSNGATVI